MSVEGILRGQAGVISRAQALPAGMSPSMITRRLSNRTWMRPHPQVHLAAVYGLTAASRVYGALLWAGRDATLSRRSAAWWHELLEDPPAMVDLTVPQGWKRPAQRGIRVRRRNLDIVDRAEVRGIPVTALPLTVLEAAVDLSRSGSTLVDRALRRHVPFADLVGAHHRSLGRHGSLAAAGLLRAASDRTASEAERVAVELLRRAGIQGWSCGYRIDGYVADIAFPSKGLVIEIDEWTWHSDVERFLRDRRRQNAIVMAGWTILRFTWHDLRARPQTVVAEVRRALAKVA